MNRIGLSEATGFARAAVALAVLASTGCGSNKATQSATGGAAIGALASGVLGGSLLGGAAVGAGLGYILGNEADKKAAEEQMAREREALEQSRLTGDPKTSYQPDVTNPLTASTWQVISLVTDDELPKWASMVVTFQTNSKMTTLTIWEDGKAESVVESYRVVEDVLVLSGRDASGNLYVVNAKYDIANGQMIVVAEDFRAVLREIEEQAAVRARKSAVGS